MRPVLLAVAALSACGGSPPCTFPGSSTSPSGVLSEADTCGYWSVAVDTSSPDDGHIYLDLHVSRELPDCALSLGDGIDVPNDPIYTNLSTDGPKYTYDFVGQSAIALTTADISCDEGTEWHAEMDVE